MTDHIEYICSFHDCECPEKSLEDFTIKPKRSSPVDNLGYTYKCCWCITLKIASVFICIITLIWGAMQLQSVDRFIADIFPEKGDDFYYTKLVYILMCILLILTCGILMLGILVAKSDVINVFVWYGFVFNCAYIGLTTVGNIFMVLRTGNMEKRQIVQLIISVMWSCLFFYLLMVVNSYKLLVWL